MHIKPLAKSLPSFVEISSAVLKVGLFNLMLPSSQDHYIYPKLKNIEFLKGEDTMKVYEFGNKVMAHKFCPNCGSTLFVLPYREDNDMMVVNVMFSVLFLIFGIADRG